MENSNGRGNPGSPPGTAPLNVDALIPLMSEARHIKGAAGASESAGSALRVAALALAMAVIPLLTLVDLLHGARWAVWSLGFASVTFVGIQANLVSAGIRRTSLALALVTGALLPFIDHPLQALERGIRIAGLIASLLLTVNLLSRAALRVPRVGEGVGCLYEVAAGQR